MEPDCGDLNVRARGLAARLVDRGRLRQLAASDGAGGLRRELLRHELADQGDVAADPQHLETALRRTAARALALLERWARARVEILSPLFTDEERRSLRVLLRGAEQGAAPELRLSGLVPTRRLPDAALAMLAEQPSASELVALLATWRHPWAGALESEIASGGVDLLRLELALERAWVEEARRATRRAGRALRRFVSESIDLANARTALALVGEEREARPDFFLDGGSSFDRERFDGVSEAADQHAALGRLLAALEGSLFGSPQGGERPRSLEGRVLRGRIETHRRAARLDPVSAEPLVAFVLALQAHLLDLGRVVWGVALGAPIERIAEDWITP